MPVKSVCPLFVFRLKSGKIQKCTLTFSCRKAVNRHPCSLRRCQAHGIQTKMPLIYWILRLIPPHFQLLQEWTTIPQKWAEHWPYPQIWICGRKIAPMAAPDQFGGERNPMDLIGWKWSNLMCPHNLLFMLRKLGKHEPLLNACCEWMRNITIQGP